MTNGEIIQHYVFKFGGSCFQNAAAFNKALNILKKYEQEKITVVCSAFMGVTDKLIALFDCRVDAEDIATQLKSLKAEHEKIIAEVIPQSDEMHKRALEYVQMWFGRLEDALKRGLGACPESELKDYVISFGERFSTFIFSCYLAAQRFSAQFVSSDEIIVTNAFFGSALPDLEKTAEKVQNKILPILNQHKAAIVTGYYGMTESGKITTLGRGGSDFSATILAYCLDLKLPTKVIFWKDVDGLLSADPRIEKRAKLLTHISYAEAKELAAFGTKILHPLCLITLERQGIPAEIRNFGRPNSENFTAISNVIEKRAEIVKAITCLPDISLVTVESQAMVSLPGTAAKLFSILGENHINIVFISQASSENNITFGVAKQEGHKTGEILRHSPHFGTHWFSVKIENDASLVAIIGAGMLHVPGVAGKLFSALGKHAINVRAIAQGSSELNITVIIARRDLENAIHVLYEVFIGNNVEEKK